MMWDGRTSDGCFPLLRGDVRLYMNFDGDGARKVVAPISLPFGDVLVTAQGAHIEYINACEWSFRGVER